MLQRPIELGADLVVHSTTKYISGHSDVMGGAVVSAREDAFFANVRQVQATYGATPSAFDCWLTLRGIRTLHLRMRAHCENARAVAAYLAEHPRVEAVHYPGLAAPAEKAIAAAQMSDFGGMLSFQVVGGRQQSMEVAGETAPIHARATSLGGTESLIEHRGLRRRHRHADARQPAASIRRHRKHRRSANRPRRRRWDKLYAGVPECAPRRKNSPSVEVFHLHTRGSFAL